MISNERENRIGPCSSTHLDNTTDLRSLLAHARCLLWRAVVEAPPPGEEGFRWTFSFFDEETAQRFLPLELLPGETYAKAFYRHKPEADRQLADRIAGEALRNGLPAYQHDTRCRRRDGEIRWLHEEVQLEAISPGRWQAIGTCTDITDRRLAEEALRESEARYRASFEHTKVAVVHTDLEHRFVRTNAAFAQMFGYSEEEILQLSMPDITHPNHLGESIQQRMPLLAGESDFFQMEKRYLHRDGHVLWGLTNVALVRDSYGRPSFYLGQVQDITARKQAEERALGLANGLREVLSAVDLLLACETLDQLLKRGVETARERLGLERCSIFLVDRSGQQVVGSYGTDGEGRTTDERTVCGEINAEWERYLQGDATTGARWSLIADHPLNYWDQGECRYLGKNSWSAATPIQGPAGPIGVLFNDSALTGAPLDRTQQEVVVVYARLLGSLIQNQLAEERLRAKDREVRAMTEQLWQAAKLATMGELAASIAHELNNPLGIMSLRLEELLMDVADGPQADSLRVVEGEIQRMAGLVSNLLQFSRRNRQHISTVDLSVEVENALELVSYLFPKHNIQVSREYSPNVPPVLADRQQIRQLLLNLIVNAIDAMAGGGTLTVRVTSNGWATVEIIDTGTGIPAELLERVTEPFFTTKAEGKGTGLGLSICQRIVQDHHGRMEVESQPGRGTTIRVRLVKVNRTTASYLAD